TAVGRIGWGLAHLVFALLGSAGVLAVTGLATGLAYGSGASLVPAALAQLPAVWVLAGMAAALVGCFPRFAAAARGLLGAVLRLAQGRAWMISCCAGCGRVSAANPPTSG